MPRLSSPDPVFVAGLGRFGTAVAETLVAMGREVLAVDRDAALVQNAAHLVTLAVEADTTDADVLRKLGVAEVGHAVVAIGSNLEASVLTASALTDLGVADIWAKALTREHGRILQRVGVHHVVYPEHDMGRRVAHLVGGRMNEYIEFDSGYAITVVSAPADAIGRTLGELGLRSRFGVTVVGLEVPGQGVTHTTADTTITPGSRLVVAGTVSDVEGFADRS